MTRPQPVPPEFSLLVSCCQWNFAAANMGPLELSSELDWSRFTSLARYHRVHGLVWNALAEHAESLPDDARQQLSSGARSIAATNLGIASECRGLQQAFADAKVPLLFVKGLTVGTLAYRSPMLKMGWDIDLLIDPVDLAMAAKLLRGRGYSLQLPSDPAHLEAWHARSKESVWCRDGSLYVELHTQLADSQWLIPGIDVGSPGQLVEVARGVSLPTLASEELFAYLAVHGASSAWFRLKWISDFAALLHGQDAESLRHLYVRSQQLGAGRAAGQALLLADTLFNVLEPVADLRRRLASEWATRTLCRAALQMLVQRTRDPTEQRLGTLTIHWTQFLLQPGLAYQVSELRRQSGAVLNRP